MLRPWLPLDIYLAWRIKAAHAVSQSRPPPQPSIPPHLFHAKRRWWANEFLWPPINHANESHPAKIISHSQHTSQRGEEVGVWLMKQASIFASTLLTLIPFFSIHSPFLQSFPFLLHFICSSLPLRAPYPPLCSFPHSSQSSFPIRFSHPSPVSGSFNISIFPPLLFPHPSSYVLFPFPSCVLSTPPESRYKLTSTLSTGSPQKCPLGGDQSAPGLTLAWGHREDMHSTQVK